MDLRFWIEDIERPCALRYSPRGAAIAAMFPLTGKMRVVQESVAAVYGRRHSSADARYKSVVIDRRHSDLTQCAGRLCHVRFLLRRATDGGVNPPLQPMA